VPRDNEAVNECWLSDRDRYSHQGLQADDRALHPLVRDADGWRETDWTEALQYAADALRSAGADLGVLAHPASTNEEGALLSELARALGTGSVDHRLQQRDFADAAVAEPFQMPVAAMEKAAAVVLVGCNIRHELPLVHQRLLKASKRGAAIVSVNPVDFEFAFAPTARRIVAPSQLAGALAGIASAAGGTLDGGLQGDGHADAQGIADALRAAGGNAVIVLGELAENHPQASRIRAAARALAAATGARLNRIPQGANAVGLAAHGVLPRDGGRDAQAMLSSPARAYLLHGIEPQFDLAQPGRALRALSGAKVVALAAFASEDLRAVADVILPIGAFPEIEGTLTNLDGLQQGGAPGGRLPGDARSGWRVLKALADQLGLAGFGFTDFAGLRAGLDPQAAQSGSGMADVAIAQDAGGSASTLERIASTPIYRGDAVLRRAPALNAHPLTTGPRAVLNPRDAARLGLREGAMLKLGDGAGTGALPLVLSPRVAEGAAWVETGYAASAPLSRDGALTVTGA